MKNKELYFYINRKKANKKYFELLERFGTSKGINLKTHEVHFFNIYVVKINQNENN